MRSSSFALAFAGVLGLTVAATVSAQQTLPQQPPPAGMHTAPNSASNGSNVDESGFPSFGDLDKGNKGHLSRSDIPKDVDGLKQLRAHFIENDKDHNGTLSPIEYATFVQNQTPESQKAPGQRQN